MSRIGDSDTMIPAIQASDIGDNEIISGTRIEQVGPDAFVLKFAMPDGSGELESTPFNSDFRRKAMLAWCDYVRQTIVDQAAEAAAKARRGKLVNPDEELAAAIELNQLPGTPANTVLTQPNYPAPPPSPAMMDPQTLIESQLRASQHALDVAIADFDRAAEKKTAAEAAVAQWTRLFDALAPSQSAPPAPPPPSSTGGDTSLEAVLASASTSRRSRARKPSPTPTAPSSPPAPPESAS